MNDERTKLLQRIFNLRAKAQDSGSSEAEMNTALIMCQKLMDAHDVAEAELAIAEATGEITLDIVSEKSDASVVIYPNPARKTMPQKHASVMTVTGIYEFTEVKSVFDAFTGVVTFTGHRPDVEFANFLLSVIKEAIEKEYELYRANNVAIGFGAKKSFQISMANRISTRLFEMAKQRKTERSSAIMEKLKIEDQAIRSSTELVVADFYKQKKEKIELAYRARYPKTTKSRMNSTANNKTAHGAGREAGDRVEFNRPIGQASAVKAISK